MADITFQDNVQICTERLSRKIEEAFVFEMRKAETFLPHKNLLAGAEPSQEQIQDEYEVTLMMFLDYSVGTLAAILSTYGTSDEAFEEIVIDLMRKKFKWLRETPTERRSQIT